MNFIELTEIDIERLKELLVKDEIARLRADFDRTISQVLAYMAHIQSQTEALAGEPFVKRQLGGGFTLGQDIVIQGTRGHAEIPDHVSDPKLTMEFSTPTKLQVATGMRNGHTA